MLKDFEHEIAEWKLIPSRGGVFEVIIDGELVFSKKQLDRHAEVDEIRQLIKARLSR
jgi:selenoprotein W-related protein